MGKLLDALTVFQQATYWNATKSLGKGFGIAYPPDAKKVTDYVTALDAGALDTPPPTGLVTKHAQGIIDMLAALATIPAPATRRIGFATGAGPNTPSALTGAALDRYYAHAKTAGGDSVRFDCRGLDTQFDNAVKAALAAGLNVLVGFPDDPTLAGPCAAKYVPLGVTDYETGNEPNIRAITPLQFFNMNNAAYAAIKKVSAATKVITAGLSPGGQFGSPVAYLQQTLTYGKLLGDQLGWHPYSYYKGATGQQMVSHYDWSAYTQLGDLTPSAHSLWDGLIACTEIGAPTWSGGVTEQAQADLVRLAWDDLSQRPYIGDIYWYSLWDRTDLDAEQNSFGVYRVDWSPKPAVAQLVAA